MIRSVNIFSSNDSNLPVRIEFWQDDQLVRLDEVKEISKQKAGEITTFILVGIQLSCSK